MNEKCRKNNQKEEDIAKGCCCCNCVNCVPGIDNDFNLDCNYYCIVFLDYPEFPKGIHKISGHGICELYCDKKD